MIVRLAAGRARSLSGCARIRPGHGVSQQQPQQTNPADQNANQTPIYEEQVVVTASKTEEQLVNAPAAVSVVSSETIQNSPATNIGDLLRAVPGVNVTQVSARDVNLTAARSDLDAVNVPTGAGRRPQRVPRFLRHGDVGSRAHQPRRNPPDRGHSRSRVGQSGAPTP
jgi:outer membrane receptor protein involved in Fe transport